MAGCPGLRKPRARGHLRGAGRVVPEWRRAHIHHSSEALGRPRVFGIACGDADQNDADTLRTAPLLKLVPLLRARWPGVTIDLRSDSGCAVPALSAWCEREQVGDTSGLLPTSRLEKVAAPLLARAPELRAATGAKARLMDETPYQVASWSHPRRVVSKAEPLDHGPHTRFGVTPRPAPPRPPRAMSGLWTGA